jgi:hypothetical protein
MRDEGSCRAIQEEEEEMAQAYCVKDKKRGRDPEPAEDHDEERQAGDPGTCPVRREGLQIGG